MNTLSTWVQTLLTGKYSIYIVLGVVVAAVLAGLYGIGFAGLMKYIKSIAKTEILAAREKGMTVDMIVDNTTKSTLEKLKNTNSKYHHLIMFTLTNKYINAAVKKFITKMVKSIIDEEEKSK